VARDAQDPKKKRIQRKNDCEFLRREQNSQNNGSTDPSKTKKPNKRF
jgi:hypothetical protein